MIPALVKILQDVGQRLLEWRGQGGTDGAWDGTQFKAEADARAHEALVEALSKLDARVPIISEEDDTKHTVERPGAYFLIDPIDGTASYAGGFPGFVTQVALIESGRPTLGAVHAPVSRKTWTAEKGRGAFLDERRLRLERPVGRLLLVDNYPSPRGISETLFKALSATGYVESGSIALKMCLVADGTADLFVKDVILRDWDVAPADLILTEAGGCFSDSRGERFHYTGSFEKLGVVAAADVETAQRALAVLDQR
jgi:3'(2'), 5'-bisphosphate nucleotidase